MSIFSRWLLAVILDLIWVGLILDHPQNVIVGLSLVLKFGLDRIYIWRYFYDFFYISAFCLKLPIQAHF